MENLTAGELWPIVLAVASAIVLLSNAGEKIVKLITAAKRPNDEQNKRIDTLEADMADVKRKLSNDKAHLETIDEGNRASQKALLALLDHGIDGNNIKQMEEAKEALRQHLINK